MGGVFNCNAHLMDPPISVWSGAASYENVHIFVRALMNIQIERMAIRAKLFEQIGFKNDMWIVGQ